MGSKRAQVGAISFGRCGASSAYKQAARGVYAGGGSSDYSQEFGYGYG